MSNKRVAIVVNGGLLAALGLKSLLLESEPQVKVSLVDSVSGLTKDLNQYATIFSFLPIAGLPVQLIDAKSSEQELKAIINKTIGKPTESKVKASESSAIGQLSKRETEVLRMVASGFINKEIAEQLHIGLQTVLSHRKHISQKLGIRTTSGFTAYAMINGIL